MTDENGEGWRYERRTENSDEPYRETIPDNSRAGKRIEYRDDIPGHDLEKPWKDGDLLRQLYVEEKMSMNQISKGWDCSATTVRDWIDKHDIPKRSRSEAQKVAWGDKPGYPFRTMKRGHEVWQTEERVFEVHRLLAICEFGADAVAGMHVHHENGIPWDNRPENLELVSNSAHQSKHRKVTGLDRLRIAELYENGDTSYRKLHETLDYDEVTWSTLMEIHHDYYGKQSDA